MLTGTTDHNESLPSPPWESEASDINPFYDNQMGFQTTYLTQQPQPYTTQQPQLYPTEQPQSYLIEQPQPYPTQQHQLYPTEQHQPCLTQQPQQISIGQESSLQPMETPTNSPYSEMQNASGRNQEAMYASQIYPYYNQNMYTYGYGNSYSALNQENHSTYNS